MGTQKLEPDALARRNFRFLCLTLRHCEWALSPLSSHTVHRGNSLRVLGGSRGTVSYMDGHALPGRLTELSNFYCLPGRAGGSPLAIRPRAPDSDSVEACNSSTGQDVALALVGDTA